MVQFKTLMTLWYFNTNDTLNEKWLNWQEFHTRGLIVVVVVNPSIVFTFKSPGWDLDDWVFEIPPRVVRHTIFKRSTSTTDDFKLFGNMIYNLLFFKTSVTLYKQGVLYIKKKRTTSILTTGRLLRKWVFIRLDDLKRVDYNVSHPLLLEMSFSPTRKL